MMRMMRTVVVFCVVILCHVVSIIQAKDYCTIAPCRMNHIGCNNNGRIDPSCASYSEFYDLANMKDSLLDKHNKYRNNIASGNMPGFLSAERMATMTWDDELAYLAGLNVKTCNFGHDRCRDTDKYRHSGQNLAFTWLNYYDRDMKDVFEDAVDSWFEEYKNTDMRSINRYGSDRSRNPIGHFTVMVADRNTKMGCAALKKVQGKSHEYIMACNYATTNMIGLPIYKSGKTASKCTKGANPKYPALCNPSEPIDPNNFN